jgi:putative flippase GtrA
MPLLDRLRAGVKRFDRLITYGVVGSLLALLQMGLTAGFVKGHVVADPTIASLMASAITIPISFWAHKRTTYADITRERFQAARFAATACSSVVIAAGAIKLVTLAGGPLWFAILLGSSLVPIGNYLVNALWVFRTKSLFSIHRSAQR